MVFEIPDRLIIVLIDSMEKSHDFILKLAKNVLFLDIHGFPDPEAAVA